MKDLRMHRHPVANEGLSEAKGEMSPLELIKYKGVAHRVKTPLGRAADSMLAVYKGRLTYTFILRKEVASIHFDRDRQEIFFRGHNIKNMELSHEQMKALENLKGILAEDEQGRDFLIGYGATLDMVLADKR